MESEMRKNIGTMLGACLSLAIASFGGGCAGDTGPAGPAGPAGPQGPAGAAGAAGAMGAMGNEGAMGTAGADGQLRIYGDGSAGAKTVNAAENWNTTPANAVNLQFTDFTVNAGNTLTVDSGMVIRCSGTFWQVTR